MPRKWIKRASSAALCLLTAATGMAGLVGTATASISTPGEISRDRPKLSFHAGVNNGTTCPNPSCPLPTSVTVVPGAGVEIFGYIRSLDGRSLSLSNRDKVDVQTRTSAGTWVDFASTEMDARFGTGKIYFTAKPTATTEYRFMVTPTCLDSTPGRPECRILTSNTVKLRVPGSQQRFESFVGTYGQAFRGDTVTLMGNLYLRTSKGREPAIDVPVTLEQLVSNRWRKIGTTRTTNAGTFSYEIRAARDSTFRWKFGGSSSERVQILVIEPDANRLSVTWPPFIDAFGGFKVTVTVVNSRGDSWQGSTSLVMQYRPNRTASWVTIASGSWPGRGQSGLSAKTQGVGYYRVTAPNLAMESQAFYS